MYVSSGSGNADSSSWSLLASFKLTFYPRDDAQSLDTRRFQAVPSSGDSRTVYNARHGPNCDTLVGVWIKRLTHWSGSVTVL